jgi:hypothetical protein
LSVLPLHCGEALLKHFLLDRLFKRRIDERLVAAFAGLKLEEGDYAGVEHDVDPLLAGRILKVNAELGTADIRLGDFRIFIKPVRYLW